MAVKKVVTTALNEVINPNECFQQLISAYTDYLKIAEQEKTKRRAIEAWETERLADINSLREVIISYLNQSFDERAKIFCSLFEVVDSAISSGNNEQLGLTLNSITEVAKSSPFKELANLANIRAALDNPDHEWTF